MPRRRANLPLSRLLPRLAVAGGLLSLVLLVPTAKTAPEPKVDSRVIRQATGELAGNALRWRYVLALPVDDKTYHVDFDDWMFLMDDKVMLNRSYMSKWGFRLGEVTLTFVKR